MLNNNLLTGKTCLITGASRGIGKAIAVSLAEHGARIIAHYKSNKKAASLLLEQLTQNDHKLIQADLGKLEDVIRLPEELKDERIDVLINNAGIYIEKPVFDMDFEEWLTVWDQTIALNLSGPAHLSYLIAGKMINQGGGRIINISSRGAFRGEPDALAYGAGKAGLNAFGQSLGKALAPKNVLVFTIAPGFVETDMARYALEGPRGDEIRAQSPLNRAAQPEEIANLVTYLASEAPVYMTTSIIDVNGASYLRS